MARRPNEFKDRDDQEIFKRYCIVYEKNGVTKTYLDEISRNYTAEIENKSHRDLYSNYFAHYYWTTDQQFECDLCHKVYTMSLKEHKKMMHGIQTGPVRAFFPPWFKSPFSSKKY